MQNFPAISADGSGEILDDLPSLIDRDEANRSWFSGASPPSNPVQWQTYRNTTDGLVYVCISTGPDVWTEFLPFLATAGGTLTGKLRMAEGAAIPSAATIDLDAATGNFVHITGVTGIGTITLAQGTWMLVCFDGVLTLTHGSNLILPTAANISTVAGDMALLIGEGSGVTRVAGYFRASGAPLPALLAAIAALDTSAGVLYQSGAGTVTKFAIGVASTTDIINRALGDARYQAAHAVLSAISADDANAGLVEQTAPGVITKRAVGVATAAAVPTRADADGRYLRQGSFNQAINAGSWIPRPSNGCSQAGLLESTTHKRVREVTNFDGTNREFMCIEMAMPKSYSGGAIKFRVHWECSGASTGDAMFGLSGASLADNETIDMAYGTAVEVTDSHNGAGKRMVSTWSADVTPSGTPAGGEMMAWEFYRKADAPGDTINGIDVQVVCVEFLIPVNAADDS